MVDSDTTFAAGIGFKERLRRALRQILFCMAICMMAWAFFGREESGREFWPIVIGMGVISGPFLWLFYKLARFVLGR